MKFNNLKVNDIVIHQIFKRTDQTNIVDPFISKKPTILPEKGLEEFRSRIIEACGDESHSSVMEIKKDSEESTFQQSAMILRDDIDEFVKKSSFFAHKLTEAQSSRRYPGGLIVVFRGTVGSSYQQFVGLLKAEAQHGFSKKETKDSLILEYFDDLVLTPAQKYYKLGIFVEQNKTKSKGLRDKKDFSAIVYDYKMTARETRLGSIYFYETFLGCEFSPSDKKLTQDFYENTREFIKQKYDDTEERVDCFNSLYVYLKVDKGGHVSTKDFGDKYIKEEHKDDYVNHMKNNKFPARSVNKDLAYIQNKLKRRSMRFTSKVSITAPAAQFNELVQINGIKDGFTDLKIKGIVEEIK
ncbi:nucleoid-associated protein [Leptospira weilii]|uniref:nucleoid-associated protein n=1 Tax=Leptospira weilii TaxID=28184 RepID=UPI00256F622D|nr:nucleoid-associated protein [Leptospira weilii]MDL5246624.1 nucleoid-associated protein [Leptospira weilii]